MTAILIELHDAGLQAIDVTPTAIDLDVREATAFGAEADALDLTLSCRRPGLLTCQPALWRRDEPLAVSRSRVRHASGAVTSQLELHETDRRVAGRIDARVLVLYLTTGGELIVECDGLEVSNRRPAARTAPPDVAAAAAAASPPLELAELRGWTLERVRIAAQEVTVWFTPPVGTRADVAQATVQCADATAISCLPAVWPAGDRVLECKRFTGGGGGEMLLLALQSQTELRVRAGSVRAWTHPVASESG